MVDGERADARDDGVYVVLDGVCMKLLQNQNGVGKGLISSYTYFMGFFDLSLAQYVDFKDILSVTRDKIEHFKL